MMIKKNNQIVIWRIIFAYIIMIYHFDNKYLLTAGLWGNSGWYIGVEFFFVVSGFLLYVKLDDRMARYKSSFAFLWHRIKHIYPYYLAAFILTLVFLLIRDGVPENLFRFASRAVFEMLALQGAGLDMGWDFINNTGWFVSVLFISEFLLFYALARWKKTVTEYVLPIVIIVCFSFLYRNLGGIGAGPQTTGFYENWGLMRGLLDMSAGILAAKWSMYLREKYTDTRLLRLMGSLGFCAVIVCSLFTGNSKIDFIYLIIISVSAALVFLPSECRIYENKFIQEWSSITLIIYLTHDMFRTSIFPMLFGYPESFSERFGLLILYIVTVTVFSAVLKEVLLGLHKAGSRICGSRTSR